MFKKADIVLVVLLLVLAFGFVLAGRSFADPGHFATVTADGALVGIYDLAVDQIVHIESANGHNTMEIRDGQASMIQSDCPGGDCLAFGRISHTNQRIVCLPNRVVIAIQGRDGVDSIAY